MATFVASTNIPPAPKQKRFVGTYRAVPKVEWTSLLAKEFGQPDWAKLYPVNEKKFELNAINGNVIYSELESKGQLLSPRQACKLFHDGLFIIKKGEESPKYIQDRIPEIAHKCFKKKQWRKQFYEAMRRVCCRLAIGLGFRPNCMAEDAFIHAILGMTFELGWRRIAEHIDTLPEWEKDRDFSRVLKFGANEEVATLLKGTDVTPTTIKKTTSTIDPKIKMDVKMGWFKCYDSSINHMFDHIVMVHDDECDGWSVTTGSTDSYVRNRADSALSTSSLDCESFDESDGRSSNPVSPNRKPRAPSLSAINEETTTGLSKVTLDNVTKSPVK